ncbi:zinc metalloproteinase nas-6-like [Oppia nitens]|uniref:zinc metalloproteinase nas-6-like n=1 Tax=Oppia nitens TaxID=1686743 RepID=UPI0023DA120C|nr:zinc metalloproteinase nas-6-like [Oppia nitens]
MLGLVPKQKGAMRKASSSKHKQWPNGVIHYKFANTFSEKEIAFIESAMKDIEDVSCIHFKKRNNERDFINIIKANGCYSYVGRIGGSQDVSLGRGCLYRGTVVHELLHALGFYHEHMRSDRDSFLTIHLNHVMPGMNNNFEKNPSSMNRLFAKFDYNSIMIYSSTAFSKDGHMTMVPKDKHFKLKEPYDKTKMTDSDASSLKKLYNCQ